VGGPLNPGNLRRRVLKPLAEEVDAPWAGFHTFRHTFASLHLRRGTNLLQLSRALGHHSPAFTLTRYTHLLPGDEAPALDSWR
jgi:integrase